MARKLRVEYPGAVYHVRNRGDHREPIFQDDRDRERFVEALGEGCLKTGWQVHAFRKELLELMGERRGANHYGEEGYESAEAKAERIMAEELRRRKRVRPN